MKKGTVKIDDVNYADELFIPHKTDTPLDPLFTVDGGIPKATNWMVVGDGGVGKSTVTLDIASNAQKNGADVLFISAEMNKIDLYLYVQRYPKFGNIETYFPQEIEDEKNQQTELENILQRGWDIVLTDSFITMQDLLRESCKMSKNAAEKYLLSVMYNHNLGENDANKNTTFINIQQVNKSGIFAGSNKLKHMTTGMIEIRFVDEKTQEERFIVFTKNRRGHVGKPMYFSLESRGDVIYDTARFKKSEKLQDMIKKEKAKLKESSHKFDELFGLDKEE